MKTREWRTLQRSLGDIAWPSGPWDGEPDKKQWRDAATGLACLAVRHPDSGHWSGYVGVPPGHKLHGLRAIGLASSSEDAREEIYRRWNAATDALDVHGGVNCGTGCQRWPDDEGGEAVGICHVPEPGEPDDLWWIGFDCAHMLDLRPIELCMERLLMQAGDMQIAATLGRLNKRAVYRDLAYVEGECTKLAAQLAALA